MKTINQIRFVALVATAATLFGGCEKENTSPADNPFVEARITSVIDAMATRAAGTAWAHGDAIGITGKSGTTEYRNVKFTTTAADGIFTPDGGATGGIYFQNTDPVDFTAYYPYAGSKGTPAGKVTANADDQTAAGQAKYDFLFARATGSAAKPDVQFRFHHCMSLIVLNFLPGKGIPTLGDLQYTIDALALEGTFDTATGKTEGTKAKKLTRKVPSNASGMSSSLIVFPQQQNSAKIEVTLGDAVYSATIDYPENPENSRKREFAAGYSYTYNIKVNKSALTISPATIKPWEKGNGENGEDVPAWN